MSSLQIIMLVFGLILAVAGASITCSDRAGLRKPPPSVFRRRRSAARADPRADQKRAD